MNALVINKNATIYLVFMMVLIGAYGFEAYAQTEESEAEKIRTYLIVDFYQRASEFEFRISVNARIEGLRGRQPVPQITVNFYHVTDTSEILLGDLITNEEGKARLRLDNDGQYPVNEDGEIGFLARFDGDDIYQSVEKEISVKEIFMDIDFVEIDSVKKVVVRAKGNQADGAALDIDEDVFFYAPGSFSLLPIGRGVFENGICEVDFPVSLPGDTIGNVSIIARIEESREFGTVEAVSKKDWGVPRPNIVIEKRRGLGDTDAPLWMVYTLIILLSAVWFHYIYVLYVFMKIKTEGNKQNKVAVN